MPAVNVRRLAWFVLVLLLVAWGLGARAGWAAQVDAMPVPHDNTRLKISLEERWRVIPLQNGLLLVPRRPASTVKGIELTRDTIAVDGQIVSGAELQHRLGADAEAVLRLSYLSAPERAELFRDAEPPLERGAGAGTGPGKGAAGSDAARASSHVGAAGSATTGGTAPNASPGSPWTEVMPVVRGDRIRLGGDASVEESEQVRSLVAIIGSADVKGLVGQDVVAIGGDVHLGPKAVVRGSVTAIGGRVHADPGAKIDGGTTELSLSNSNLRVWLPLDGGKEGDFNVAIAPDWPRIARYTFGSGILFALCWFVLCAGALVVLPTGVSRARAGIAWSPISAFLVGVATQVLFGPALLLIMTALSISVIGIPLLAAIPVAIFALFLAGLLGFTGVLVAMGERLVGRGMPLVALMVGGSLVFAIGLSGQYLWMMRGGASTLGVVLAVSGLVIEYLAATFGLGGALIAWTILRRAAAQSASFAPITPSAPLSLDI